jgi:hypothetical protein
MAVRAAQDVGSQRSRAVSERTRCKICSHLAPRSSGGRPPSFGGLPGGAGSSRSGRAGRVQVERHTCRTTWTRAARSGGLWCVTGESPAGLPGVPRSRASSPGRRRPDPGRRAGGPTRRRHRSCRVDVARTERPDPRGSCGRRLRRCGRDPQRAAVRVLRAGSRPTTPEDRPRGTNTSIFV